MTLFDHEDYLESIISFFIIIILKLNLLKYIYKIHLNEFLFCRSCNTKNR
jgi:hypothetical protein